MSVSLKEQAIVECPHCGADNRLGAPLCSACGERVYGSNAPPVVKKRFHGGFKVGIRNGVLAFTILLVLMVVALALWPFPPLVQAKVAATTSPMTSFLRDAQRELNEGRVIPEGQMLESYFNAYAREQLGEASGKVLSVYITKGKLVMVSDEKNGPFKISTRLVLVEDKEEGVLVDSLWLGHLPLPRGMAKGWFEGFVERNGIVVSEEMMDRLVIRALDREKVLWGDRTVEVP